MSILSINFLNITFLLLVLVVLYVYAISLLFKNKAGILPYLSLIFFPVIGPIGIIVGDSLRKK